MQQRRHSETSNRLPIYESRIDLLVFLKQRPTETVRLVNHSERVIEPGMRYRGIGQVGKARLVKLPKSLEQRSVKQRDFVLI